MNMQQAGAGFGCLSLLLSTLFFEARSLTESGAHQLGKADWPVGSKNHPLSDLPEVRSCTHQLIS